MMKNSRHTVHRFSNLSLTEISHSVLGLVRLINRTDLNTGGIFINDVNLSPAI